jgi:hypothetical protein
MSVITLYAQFIALCSSVKTCRRCFTVVDLLCSISIFEEQEEQNDPSDREVLW